MITYKDLQGKLKTLHDKALSKAVKKLQKELKRKDLKVAVDSLTGNPYNHALYFYLDELKNTEIGLLWLLFGVPGWDGYENKGANGEDILNAIIYSEDDDDSVWDYDRSVPNEIDKYGDMIAAACGWEDYDEDDNLSEANKYFFGTDNTNEVKKLFESESPRPISEIAAEIDEKWPKVSPAARPYLDAMYDLETIDDKYMYDDAESIILYFLSNAASWRGDDAKRIKKELKELCK